LTRIESRFAVPRQALLNKSQQTGLRYNYALLGDSVFCSPFVDNESQTLWKQIGNTIGEPVFPGALNGAHPRDLVNAAIYYGKLFKPGTVVIIDVMPGRNWEDDRENYKNRFEEILGNYDCTWRKNDLSNLYLDFMVNLYPYRIGVSDLKTVIRWITNYVPSYKTAESHNRIWNRDGDLAFNRFKSWNLESGHTSYEFNFSRIDIIAKELLYSKLEPIFILTPLNVYLLNSYPVSGTTSPIRWYSSYRESLVSHLKSNHLTYLDLTGLVPSEGFADLVHTNAYGDALMSRAIARFIKAGQATGHR